MALQFSTPEQQGVHSTAITAFIKFLKENNMEAHSFLLMKHGHVIAEAYYKPYSQTLPHMLFSLSKSFTSTAIGFAVTEQLLRVEDDVHTFFTEEIAEVKEQVDEKFYRMKVKHLLSMATGQEYEPFPKSPEDDLLINFLICPILHEPGTTFMYNSMATYMLSAIIQKVTNSTLLDYLTPRLFDPLAIKGMTWSSDRRGIHHGGYGLNLKTRDIAKFGQLYLQKGVWEGKQIIPEVWVEEATTKKIENGTDAASDWAQGYCYQFWRCKNNAYRGDGMMGQFCIVFPDEDAVVAVTSNLDMQKLLDAVYDILLPEFKNPQPLPENPSDQEQLLKQIQELTLLEVPETNAEWAKNMAYKQFGYTIKNDTEMAALIDSFSFSFFEDYCLFKTYYKNNDLPQVIKIGIDCWVDGVVSSHEMSGFGDFVEICSNGSWISENEFQFSVLMVETPTRQVFTCKFDGENSSVQLLIPSWTQEPIVL